MLFSWFCSISQIFLCTRASSRKHPFRIHFSLTFLKLLSVLFYMLKLNQSKLYSLPVICFLHVHTKESYFFYYLTVKEVDTQLVSSRVKIRYFQNCCLPYKQKVGHQTFHTQKGKKCHILKNCTCYTIGLHFLPFFQRVQGNVHGSYPFQPCEVSQDETEIANICPPDIVRLNFHQTQALVILAGA